jgi:hypothetical protein
MVDLIFRNSSHRNFIWSFVTRLDRHTHLVHSLALLVCIARFYLTRNKIRFGPCPVEALLGDATAEKAFETLDG